jgi:sulfate transport system ATP-binding protein
MDFLGKVNVFHGRVQRGVARLGGLEVEAPEFPHADERPATGYVRPHEMEIERAPNGGPSAPARVVHINPVGAVTRVQLRTLDADDLIHVEVGRTRSGELGLKVGETVYLAPRKVHVFTPDYSI